MTKALAVLFVGIFSLAIIISGCGKKPADSNTAIEQSMTLKTVPEKANFLLGRANTFLRSKEFNDAIKTAQYVLSNLDTTSTEAQDIIEKAKAELQKVGQQTITDFKNKFGTSGK